MKTMHKDKQSGFTLMEILIAVAVLAIGVVSVVNLFPVGLQAARRTANFSDAAALAQRQLEIYRSEYDYDDMVSMFSIDPSDADSFGHYPVTPGEKLPFSSPYEDYSWFMLVSNIDVNLRLLEAALNIYWLDGGQEQYEIFFTYIADYEE